MEVEIIMAQEKEINDSLFVAETTKNTKFIVEEAIDATTGEKKTYIQGIFLETDVKNENGRVYPRKIIEKAMIVYAEKIKDGTAYGELNHPHKAEINLANLCFRIINLELDKDGKLIGKGLILDTTAGKELKAVIAGGVNIGVSIRGAGPMSTNNIMQDGYEIIAIDVVANPSFTNAMMNIVNEQKETKNTKKLSKTAASIDLFLRTL